MIHENQWQAEKSITKLETRKMKMIQEINRLGDSDSAEGYVKSTRASISNLKRTLRRGSMGKKVKESMSRAREEGGKEK